MGVKQDWQADPATTGTLYRHHYGDEGSRLIWAGYRVVHTLRLRRDRNRLIRLELTPDQAEELAETLIVQARMAREFNQTASSGPDPIQGRTVR